MHMINKKRSIKIIRKLKKRLFPSLFSEEKQIGYIYRIGAFIIFIGGIYTCISAFAMGMWWQPICLAYPILLFLFIALPS